MKFRFSILLLLLTVLRLNAQNDSAATAAPSRFVFQPAIGLGTGMLSFYGDLYQKHFISPQVSRIGYEFSFSQPINPSLRVGLTGLVGTLGANERLVNRNTNFESKIISGGLTVEYTFAHLLHEKARVFPWISAGAAWFSYKSKTDLKDANGNSYYYWSDGSIRNIDENDPNAINAVILQRDYAFETDIRALNLDGFGNYPVNSFTVPAGAGILLKLTGHWEVKAGAVMHFSFTDYVDGVTEKSLGNRQGDARNDHFMMTSVTLRYNLFDPKKNKDASGNDLYAGVNYKELAKSDYDEDGVLDAEDLCGDTPKGVPVDRNGCPLDSDKDEVPDYRDDETASAPGAIVNERGVTLSDSAILMQHEMYWDSTGKFAKTVVLRAGGTPYSGPVNERKMYSVSLGQYKSGLPNDVMSKFLNMEDISSKLLPDSSTIYTVGKYEDLRTAEKRKRSLQEQGVTAATVVYETPGGTFKEVTNVFSNGSDASGTNTAGTATTSNSTSAGTNSSNASTVNDGMPTNDKLVYRVQLGAYRNRQPKGTFADIPDLIEIKGDDGLFRYLSGSFATFDDAAGHKINLLVKGYKGAFIVAYKNGKRVSLPESGR